MKIIHCADIHLDSPMNRLSTSEKRKERKAELIKAFSNMVDFAVREGAKAIIISGDLFDQSKISATAKNAFIGAVEGNPDIEFYYIQGNHDKSDFLNEIDDVPGNLHLFSDTWTTYELGEKVSVTGVELNKDNASVIYSQLNLDLTHFNIAALHGQKSAAAARDNAPIISIRDLKNKGIDYLALGHIHSYKTEKLDNRGTYCYPGCLEARGFDETEEHGFVVLDINTADRSFTVNKVSDPIRTPRVIPVDISDCMTSAEILDRIEEMLESSAYPPSDMVKIELTGDVDFECEKNLSFLETQLKDRYYDFKIKDLTDFRVDYDKFKLDESLKGEFVRIVEAEEGISPEDKAEIIRIGIRALMGEEVE